jgi:outer membrane lipoprotein SlyB
MRTSVAWSAPLFAGACLMVAGCSHATRSPVYGGSSVGTPVSASPVAEQSGRIIAVKDVVIQGSAAPSSATPGRSGSALGTAAQILRGGVGAIGVIADAVKGSGSERAGEEITIATDDGRTIILVQERSTPPLAPDERVVIQKGVAPSGGSGGTTRVVREVQFAAADPLPARRR